MADSTNDAEEMGFTCGCAMKAGPSDADGKRQVVWVACKDGMECANTKLASALMTAEGSPLEVRTVEHIELRSTHDD